VKCLQIRWFWVWGAGGGGLSKRTEYRSDNDLVFAHPQTGSPLDRSKLSKRFKAACRDAGVREVKFHDLRHTFATRRRPTFIAMLDKAGFG
jgi:integrase